MRSGARRRVTQHGASEKVVAYRERAAKPTERKKERGRRGELLAPSRVFSGNYEARMRDGRMEEL